MKWKKIYFYRFLFLFTPNSLNLWSSPGAQSHPVVIYLINCILFLLFGRKVKKNQSIFLKNMTKTILNANLLKIKWKYWKSLVFLPVIWIRVLFYLNANVEVLCLLTFLQSYNFSYLINVKLMKFFCKDRKVFNSNFGSLSPAYKICDYILFLLAWNYSLHVYI